MDRLPISTPNIPIVSFNVVIKRCISAMAQMVTGCFGLDVSAARTDLSAAKVDVSHQILLLK